MASEQERVAAALRKLGWTSGHIADVLDRPHEDMFHTFFENKDIEQVLTKEVKQKLFRASMVPEDVTIGTLPIGAPIPQRLRCEKCEGFATMPVRLQPCGHLLCPKCLPEIAEKMHCPICHRLVEDEVLDYLLVSAIARQRIYCTGCAHEDENGNIVKNYEGTFNTLSWHLEACPSSLIPCQYSYNGCNEVIARGKMEEHLKTCEWRPEPCPDCGVLFPHCRLEEHRNECDFRMVECPWGCNEKVRFTDLERHRLKCKKSVIMCPIVGCGVELPAEEIEAHMVDEKYLGKHFELLARLKERCSPDDRINPGSDLEEAEITVEHEALSPENIQQFMDGYEAFVVSLNARAQIMLSRCVEYLKGPLELADSLRSGQHLLAEVQASGLLRENHAERISNIALEVARLGSEVSGLRKALHKMNKTWTAQVKQSTKDLTEELTERVKKAAPERVQNLVEEEFTEFAQKVVAKTAARVSKEAVEKFQASCKMLDETHERITEAEKKVAEARATWDDQVHKFLDERRGKIINLAGEYELVGSQLSSKVKEGEEALSQLEDQIKQTEELIEKRKAAISRIQEQEHKLEEQRKETSDMVEAIKTEWAKKSRACEMVSLLRSEWNLKLSEDLQGTVIVTPRNILGDELAPETAETAISKLVVKVYVEDEDEPEILHVTFDNPVGRFSVAEELRGKVHRVKLCSGDHTIYETILDEEPAATEQKENEEELEKLPESNLEQENEQAPSSPALSAHEEQQEEKLEEKQEEEKQEGSGRSEHDEERVEEKETQEQAEDNEHSSGSSSSSDSGSSPSTE